MATNSSNYKSSAKEFGKRLTALYKLKIFPRAGSDLAEKLYSSGIEAGANIASLASLTDAGIKCDVAVRAVVKLNEVEFAARLMVEGEFYTEDETLSLLNYIDKLVEALSKMIATVKQKQANEAARAVKPQRKVIEQKPVARTRVVIRSSEEIVKEAQAEADKLNAQAQQPPAPATAEPATENAGETNAEDKAEEKKESPAAPEEAHVADGLDVPYSN